MFYAKYKKATLSIGSWGGGVRIDNANLTKPFALRLLIPLALAALTLVAFEMQAHMSEHE